MIRKLLPICVICVHIVHADPKTLELFNAGTESMFPAGKPVRISIKDLPETGLKVVWKTVSYYGENRNGSISGKDIDLGIFPPGYYAIRINAFNDNGDMIAQSRETGIAVLTALPEVLKDPDSPFGLHNTLCWGRLADSNAKALAQLNVTAGYIWNREYLILNDGISKAKGVYDLSRYKRLLEISKSSGLKTTFMTHHAPSWAKKKQKSTDPLYEDLRDLYYLIREIAVNLRGLASVYEGINEPDSSWMDEHASPYEYASYFKTFALGIKAGDKDAQIATGPIAWGTRWRAPYFIEGDLYRYADIYNFHVYDNTPQSDYRTIPGSVSNYIVLGKATGLVSSPHWVTECGDYYMPGKGNMEPIPAGEVDYSKFPWDNYPGMKEKQMTERLSPFAQKHQAEFAVKTIVLSLASGIDRHFYFLLNPMVQDNVYFSPVRPDLTPYPAYVSLSALTRQLGRARWLGSFVPAPGSIGHVFDSGYGLVAVLFSTEMEKVEATLGALSPSTRIINMMGNDVTAQYKFPRISITPEPVYLTALPDSIRHDLSAQGIAALRERPLVKRNWNETSRIIIRWNVPLPISLEQSRYAYVPPALTQEAVLEIYNLSEEPDTVRLSITSGKKEIAALSLSMEAMGRVTTNVTLGQDTSVEESEQISAAEATDKSGRVSRSIIRLLWNTPPVKKRPFTDVAPIQWLDSAIDRTFVTKNENGNGSWTWKAQFPAAAKDWWIFPTITFDDCKDLSEFNAIGFTLSVSRGSFDGSSGTKVGVVIQENDGDTASTFMGNVPAPLSPEKPTRYVLRFDEMSLAGFRKNAKKGAARLDASRIKKVSIGGNGTYAKTPEIEWTLSELEWVLVR
ncbi:MAG: hypothetical protein AABZ39_19815 [Spirochaetota bacterium]